MKKKRIKELRKGVEEIGQRSNTLEKAIPALKYRCPPKTVEFKRYTTLPPITASKWLDEEWLKKPLQIGDLKRAADFLKECLKDESGACSLVVTKDLIYMLYKIAKEKIDEWETGGKSCGEKD